MKSFINLFIFMLSLSVFSQQGELNLDKGLMAKGYDVVAYLQGKAIKGHSKFETEYNGAKYRFSSLDNLEKFQKDSEKYIPAYGGYCAYAMAKTGEKVDINPKSFEVREGKLYLFYLTAFNNTYELWLTENPKALIAKANRNYDKLIVN